MFQHKMLKTFLCPNNVWWVAEEKIHKNNNNECHLGFKIYCLHGNYTAHLKKSGIGQNRSCALELLRFETLPS